MTVLARAEGKADGNYIFYEDLLVRVRVVIEQGYVYTVSHTKLAKTLSQIPNFNRLVSNRLGTLPAVPTAALMRVLLSDVGLPCFVYLMTFCSLRTMTSDKPHAGLGGILSLRQQ